MASALTGPTAPKDDIGKRYGLLLAPAGKDAGGFVLQHLCAQDCYYCTAPPANTGLKKFNRQCTYNGIGRLDNTRGYTVDNVVPCYIVCNMAKSDLTMPDFISWVNRISQNLLHNQEVT